MNKRNANVIIPAMLNNSPQKDEIEIAWIVAKKYNQTVKFLNPVNDYKRKTADIVMNGQLWEMKTPTGNSKNTIERQVKRATKQSHNIIIDGRRSSITDDLFQLELKKQCTLRHSIRKLIYIRKNSEPVEILWK